MWPFSDPRIGEREFRRLVVRVPNPMGDQIMATPALQAVRERYGSAHITLHGSKAAEGLYRGAPYFDDFLITAKREKARVVARALREREFDACLLLTGSFRSALPPFLARIPHRIGFRWSGRTPLLTAHWPRPRPGGKKAPYPTKVYYLDLIAPLGARGGGRVRLELDDRTRERGDEWLRSVDIGENDPILAMCVGAAFGPSKIWPAEHFAAVADHMGERHGARAVVLCAPGEEEIGAAVSGHAKRPLIDTGRSPLGAGLLKAVIARSRILLTNDTGPRHIAAAFLVPSVCVMGPTDPIYTETDLERQIVLRNPVPCQPCHKKICPVEGHPCMSGVGPDRVIEALERMWNDR